MFFRTTWTRVTSSSGPVARERITSLCPGRWVQAVAERFVHPTAFAGSNPDVHNVRTKQKFPWWIWIFILQFFLGVWEHLPAHRCEGAGQGQLLLPGPVPLDRGRGVRRSGRNYRQVNTSRVEVMDVQSALDYFPDPDLTFLSTKVAFYEQRKGRKRLTTFCTATKDIP